MSFCGQREGIPNTTHDRREIYDKPTQKLDWESLGNLGQSDPKWNQLDQIRLKWAQLGLAAYWAKKNVLKIWLRPQTDGHEDFMVCFHRQDQNVSKYLKYTYLEKYLFNISTFFGKTIILSTLHTVGLGYLD